MKRGVLLSLLEKRASGFSYEEVIEEYVEVPDKLEPKVGSSDETKARSGETPKEGSVEPLKSGGVMEPKVGSADEQTIAGAGQMIGVESKVSAAEETGLSALEPKVVAVGCDLTTAQLSGSMTKSGGFNGAQLSSSEVCDKVCVSAQLSSSANRDGEKYSAQLSSNVSCDGLANSTQLSCSAESLKNFDWAQSQEMSGIERGSESENGEGSVAVLQSMGKSVLQCPQKRKRGRPRKYPLEGCAADGAELNAADGSGAMANGLAGAGFAASGTVGVNAANGSALAGAGCMANGVAGANPAPCGAAGSSSPISSSSNMKLVKRKVQTYYVPPDMTAIKLLLELQGEDEHRKKPKEDVMELARRKKQLLDEIKEELKQELEKHVRN